MKPAPGTPAAFSCAAALLVGCAQFTPSAHMAELDFSLVRNQVLVQARLRSEGPFACLVDTGADPSVIDLGLARQLGLPMSETSARAQGVGHDDVPVRKTSVDVRLGENAASRIDAVALDLGALSRAFGQPIPCILGQSWLAQRVVEIDYPRRRLRFAESRREEARCLRMPMRFWMEGDLMPLVTVLVNGRDVEVSLDTGSSGTLRLFSEAAGTVGVELEPGNEASVVGARGRAAVTPARVQRLQFGPLELVDARITVGERNAGEAPGRSGNLGNGLLRLGVLTLDYPARRLRVCAADNR